MVELIRGTIIRVSRRGLFGELIKIHVSGMSAVGGDFFLKRSFLYLVALFSERPASRIRSSKAFLPLSSELHS